MTQATSLGKAISLGEMQRALPAVCTSLVFSYAGDPTLPNDALTYKLILDAYRGQEILSRFTLEIPEDLPLTSCEGRVMAIHRTVMELAHQASTDAPFISLKYSRGTNRSIKPALEADFERGMAPLALAPIMERVAPLEDEDLIEIFSDIVKNKLPEDRDLRMLIEDPSVNKAAAFREQFAKNPLKFASITELSLNSHLLSILPREVATLVNLRKFHLGHNKLKEPYALRSLPNLQELGYYNSCLNEVPRTIQHLPSLIRLDLTNNNLSTLPEWFINLENLEELDLKHNEFTEFPKILDKLGKLRIVDLKYNRFSGKTLLGMHFSTTFKKYVVHY